MAMLDVFRADAFSLASLTEAINKMPFPPARLGSLGLFSDRPVSTTTIKIEEREGILNLLSTAGRGSMLDARSRPQRKVRNFTIPHVPLFANILADDVQNIRAFGSETEMEALSTVINDQLQAMSADHSATQEFHRVGATKGVVLDGDNSTVIYDFFTEFGITPYTKVTVDFSTADVKQLGMDMHRNAANALGATPYTGLIAICGDDFFDALVGSTSVTSAFDRWRDGEFFRQNQIGPDFVSSSNGFMYADVFWFNYRGKIGDVDYYAPKSCWVVPMGVPGLFIEALAPADFNETVNTRGQRFYAKQRVLDWEKGVELHTQSNTLAMCTRPQVLQELDIA